MILATSFPSLCWGFAIRHPGLMLVLIGVAGEVACDWKEMAGRLAWAKKLSAMLLVIGLVVEFWESAKLDNEVADTKERTAIAVKDASQANERAANTESNNLVLDKQLTELKARLQHRIITPEQRGKFIKALEGCRRGNIIVAKLSIENETGAYARDIRMMLDAAGYPDNQHGDVIFFPSSSHDSQDVQIYTFVKNKGPDFVYAIRKAFEGIGIKTIIQWPDRPFTFPIPDYQFLAHSPMPNSQEEAMGELMILVTERQ